jgi:hypothetical protein
MLSFRYNALIVAFWLSAMSWLVVAKVLPPLLLGEPPTYRTILATDPKHPVQSEHVTWDIEVDQRKVGAATTSVVPMSDGVRELRSDVRFWDLPLDSISPLRLGAYARLPDGRPRSVSLGAKATFEVDPLGRLLGFESTLELGVLAEPIRVQGAVEGTQLHLTVRSGDFVYRHDSVLPNDSLLSDALSPQSRLPGLRVGQTWLVPLYSPFHQRTQPLEALEARVERTEPLVWHGSVVETLLVVYYDEQGGRLGGASEPRGRLWVHPDGTVLQQEAPLVNSMLRFVRRPESDTEPTDVTPRRQRARFRGGQKSPTEPAETDKEGASPE